MIPHLWNQIFPSLLWLSLSLSSRVLREISKDNANLHSIGGYSWYLTDSCSLQDLWCIKMGKGRPTHSSPSLLTSYSNRTEGPSTDGIRCGKWLLRSTCVRRRRGQPLSLKFEPSTPTSKRKRRASSPTPLANSFTGENSVQVANKDAGKFIGKWLDHYDLLHELVDGSLATGVFSQPSPVGAPSLEQEQALRNQGKAIKFSVAHALMEESECLMEVVDQAVTQCDVSKKRRIIGWLSQTKKRESILNT